MIINNVKIIIILYNIKDKKGKEKKTRAKTPSEDSEVRVDKTSLCIVSENVNDSSHSEN
jgi:hypothetical protein